MEKKKINCSELFDSIQDFLMGENGCPTMKKRRTCDGSLVFEDCGENELDEFDLLSWYEDLVNGGLIEDTLEIVGKTVELVDDYDFDEDEEEDY